MFQKLPTPTFPVVEFSDLRSTLRTGDVVTFDSDDLLGRAIRACAGVGTHTAMVIHLGEAPNTLFLMEAQAHGIILTNLDKRISNYNGRVFITQPPGTDVERANCGEVGLKLIGAQIPYDYFSLFRCSWTRVPVRMDHGYCTESVQYCHMQAGLMHPRVMAMVPGDYLRVNWPTVRLAAFTLEGE